jgi:hypothetical protein
MQLQPTRAQSRDRRAPSEGCIDCAAHESPAPSPAGAARRPGLAALVLPASAEAHGIVGKADLPIPVWLFSWTAAIVLVVSFVALSTLWTRPQLQQPRLQAAVLAAAGARMAGGPVRRGLFALVLYSGFAGAQVAAGELLGDVHLRHLLGRDAGRERAVRRHLPRAQPVAHVRARSPRSGALRGWRQRARCCATRAGSGCGRRRRDRRLRLARARLRRPRPPVDARGAVARLLPRDARRDGAVRGREWSEQADGFGVYFNLLSKLSALVRGDDGALYLRRPLSGVTDLEIRAGTVAFICTQIGTTTFDGFSNGGIWRNNEPSLQSLFAASASIRRRRRSSPTRSGWCSASC